MYHHINPPRKSDPTWRPGGGGVGWVLRAGSGAAGGTNFFWGGGFGLRSAGVACSLHSTRDDVSESRFRAAQCYNDPTMAMVADLIRGVEGVIATPPPPSPGDITSSKYKMSTFGVSGVGPLRPEYTMARARVCVTKPTKEKKGVARGHRREVDCADSTLRFVGELSMAHCFLNSMISCSIHLCALAYKMGNGGGCPHLKLTSRPKVFPKSHPKPTVAQIPVQSLFPGRIGTSKAGRGGVAA